jgi:hypothetical protein
VDRGAAHAQNPQLASSNRIALTLCTGLTFAKGAKRVKQHREPCGVHARCAGLFALPLHSILPNSNN